MGRLGRSVTFFVNDTSFSVVHNVIDWPQRILHNKKTMTNLPVAKEIFN